jgi:hypothetical protein
MGTGPFVRRPHPVPFLETSSITPRLEDDLQAELNFPHRHLGLLIDRAKTIHRARIKNVEVVRRWCIIRTVQNIEKLRTELDVEILAEFGNAGVLDQGKVNVEQSRPDNRVTWQVAQEIRAGQRVRIS